MSYSVDTSVEHGQNSHMLPSRQSLKQSIEETITAQLQSRKQNTPKAKPQSMAMTSTFEVLGPVMVGPSSSHTAGALRCSEVARSLMTEPVAKAQFVLWNSFAHTYKGHGTDRALVAGVLGYDTDDPRIRDAFDHAKKEGIEVEFTIAGDDASIHPNTVDIILTGKAGSTLEVRGESLGGAKMRISRINGVEVELSGSYPTLFVTHQDAPGALAAMTGCLADAEVNIAFLRTYRPDSTGTAYSIFETDNSIPLVSIERMRAIEFVIGVTPIELPGTLHAIAPGVSRHDLFDNGTQMLDAAEERGMSIGELIAMREENLIGKELAERSMERLICVMQNETDEPLVNPKPSLGGFLGGQAQRIDQQSKNLSPHLLGAVQSKATARAMAVLERSAAMGVMVAAPTAGASGIIPGSILSVAEAIGASKEHLAHALYCAAGVGMCIQALAFVAGAEGGCQAEVGSAAAMAAAGLVELLGGSPKQALDASSLALSNLLGLVCDPVGGLVEIPCQARNAVGVAAAFSAAQLSLSGVGSFIPFDEVVHAMAEVGHALPTTLKETARGGLAVTPTACELCGLC